MVRGCSVRDELWKQYAPAFNPSFLLRPQAERTCRLAASVRPSYLLAFPDEFCGFITQVVRSFSQMVCSNYPIVLGGHCIPRCL